MSHPQQMHRNVSGFFRRASFVLQVSAPFVLLVWASAIILASDLSGPSRQTISSAGDAQGYEAQAQEPGAASQQDKDRASGVRLVVEGQQLSARKDSQSVLKAIEKYEESRKIWQALKDIGNEATTLFLMGQAYASIYEWEKALKAYTDASLMLPPGDESLLTAGILSEIGSIYAAVFEDPKEAIKYYERALPILMKQPDLLNAASMLNNIGQLYNAILQPKPALEYFMKSLALYQQRKEKHESEATLRSNIGYAYFLQKNPQEALKYYEQALEMYMKQDDPWHAAGVLNNMGQVKESTNRPQEALDFYERARQIYHRLEDRSHEVTVLGNMGLIYEAQNRKQEALDSYQAGVDLLEVLRSSATKAEIRAGISNSLTFVYKANVLLMEQGQHVRAFNLTERARSRGLLDQLGNARQGSPQITNPQLIQEEQDIRARLASIEKDLRRETLKSFSALNESLIHSLRTQYAATQDQYEDFFRRVMLGSPESASFRSINTLTLTEVQKLLSWDTTLVSYFTGPEKSWAFVITRGTFRAVNLKAKDQGLLEMITWARRAGDTSGSQAEKLRKLHELLIAPVKPYIKTPTVGIIPHRYLHYLSFAALTDGRRYFGDEYNLFYLPSASVLPFLQGKKSAQTATQVLAMSQRRAEGLPLLHYADQEAESVARLYHTQALTTGKASKSEFLKRAGESDIIHIAAHAELNAPSPLFYRIRLRAENDEMGRLELREIYNLNLSKAELVVLSACQTEVGEHSIGDDIVALNRAFISAGTQTVIASLWTVDDASTSYLMKSFYIHLKRGMSKAEALRAAQSFTRKKYPNPYHWAAFVLTGDPGQTTSTRDGRRQ